MSEIKIYKKIETKDPILIAGWPGMGSVALGAVNYMRRKMETTLFAEIETSSLFTPEAIVIEDGMAKLPELPRSGFFAVNNAKLIVFESDAQVSGQEGLHLMNLILNFARELKVSKILTGAAFPMPISHLEHSTIYGVANRQQLRDWLTEYKVKIMEKGQISGLNGLLLGYAEKVGIEAACLLATIPNYAISFPNPKASKAIVSVLTNMLNIDLDMRELNAFAHEMDKRMEAIEKKIQEMFPTAAKEEHVEKLDEKEVPKYIMEKIEQLFREAKSDKRKAFELKEELDRWNLFKFYEDRFLDLFKEDQ